jgi:hypothetical protein
LIYEDGCEYQIRGGRGGVEGWMENESKCADMKKECGITAYG